MSSKLRPMPENRWPQLDKPVTTETFEQLGVRLLMALGRAAGNGTLNGYVIDYWGKLYMAGDATRGFEGADSDIQISIIPNDPEEVLALREKPFGYGADVKWRMATEQMGARVAGETGYLMYVEDDSSFDDEEQPELVPIVYVDEVLLAYAGYLIVHRPSNTFSEDSEYAKLRNQIAVCIATGEVPWLRQDGVDMLLQVALYGEVTYG